MHKAGSSGKWLRSFWFFLLGITLPVLAVVLSSGVIHGRVSQSEVPSLQITVPGKVTEVYDGDTVTVETTIRVRVRLIDCWAPELRERGGVASRNALREYAQGKSCKLHVDLKDVDRVDDVMSFGRVVGSVWVGKRNLSEYQVSSGNAFRNKP